MKKRDVIVISVLVNAGLLLILFISAITTKESTPLSTKPLAMQNFDPASFSENTNLQEAVSSHEEQKPLTDLLPLSEKQVVIHEAEAEPILEKKQELIHKLPAATQKKLESKPFVEVVVKSGDSLEKIAKRHHSTVSLIEEKNQLTSHLLQVGQKLKVPTKDIAKKADTKVVKKASSEAEYYIVKYGDNPWTIAMKHHLKVQDLLKLNNLNNEKARKIKPGDKLRIR